MVTTLETTRSKPTKEEAIYMIKSAPRISIYGENVPCPRCGQTLLYEQIRNSYVIDSFARAFSSLHGITPSDAKRPGVTLKAYPKMSFQISIKGESAMDYRIETKEG